MSYIGQAPGLGQRALFRYVALAGQTVIAGRDAAGIPLGYTPRFVDVFLNGQLLSGPDYVATDGSTITIATALNADDEVVVIAQAPFSPANTYTQAQADALQRRRNRIIDPGMRVSQENGSNLLTLASGLGVFPSDSIQAYRGGGTGGATVQRIQQITPGGSPFRQRLTITAVNGAPASTDILSLHTNIEGLDVADLKFGSANAKTVILRVGIRASLPGNYALALRNIAGSANRSFIGTISVAANEVGQDLLRVLVIPGDVTGTWSTEAFGAMQVRLTLCSGSNFIAPAGSSWQAGNYLRLDGHTNLMEVNGATFDLFDVGLYDATGLTGATLPAFELDSFAHDFIKCQRYYQKCSIRGLVGLTAANVNTYLQALTSLPVVMRTNPTLTYTDSNGTPSRITLSDGSSVAPTVGNVYANSVSAWADAILNNGFFGWWLVNATLNARL